MNKFFFSPLLFSFSVSSLAQVVGEIPFGINPFNLTPPAYTYTAPAPLNYIGEYSTEAVTCLVVKSVHGIPYYVVRTNQPWRFLEEFTDKEFTSCLMLAQKDLKKKQKEDKKETLSPLVVMNSSVPVSVFSGNLGYVGCTLWVIPYTDIAYEFIFPSVAKDTLKEMRGGALKACLQAIPKQLLDPTEYKKKAPLKDA